ncbi:MAG: hypothetical protein ACO3PR_18130 [Limisphaerales bacterium]
MTQSPSPIDHAREVFQIELEALDAVRGSLDTSFNEVRINPDEPWKDRCGGHWQVRQHWA